MGSGDTAQHHNIVAAAIVRNGAVLLCHRHPDREWYPNVWDVPGGHIDDGESPMDALVREIREELGIEIDRASAVSVIQHSPKKNLDIEIWAVSGWTGEIVNAEPAEHDAIGWFTVPEIDGLELADPDVAVACKQAVVLFGRQSDRPES